MRKLQPSDVKWQGSIYLDKNFCTFLYAGCYYKAMLPTAAFSSEMYTGVFAGLAKKRLIPPTVPSDLQIDCLGPIFEQRTEFFNVPFYYINWHSLKESALLFLDLAAELAKRDLWTQDGHNGNIIFQGAMRPRWCDVGSFIRFSPDTFTGILEQFIKYFVYPLLLPQKPDIFNVFKATANHGVSHDFAVAMGVRLPYRQIFEAKNYESAIAILVNIIKETRYHFPEGKWSSYYGDDKLELDSLQANPQAGRTELFFRIFKTISPKSVVDIGANTGLFSRYMAKTAEVLAIEPDPVAVAKAWQILSEGPADLSLKLALADVHESWQACANGRLRRGQMATALALTHHLFFTERYPWKYIAMILAEHCEETLLTEFMPWGLYTTPPPVSMPPEYTAENFAKALEKYFEKVEILPYPIPAGVSPRVFLLCTNKRARPIEDGWGLLPAEMLGEPCNPVR